MYHLLSLQGHTNSVLSNSQKSNSLQDFGAHSRPQPRNSGLAASLQKGLQTVHATKLLMFHVPYVPHRSRIRPQHRQRGKEFQNVFDSFCPSRRRPTWSFPLGDHCLIFRFCKVRSCARHCQTKKQQKTSCKDWQIHDSIPSNSWWTGAPWFVLLLLVVLTWRKGDTSS